VTENGDEESQSAADEGMTVYSKFFLLLALGFVLVFVGVAVIVIAAVLYGSASGSFGAVIFIGPIPIIIGAGTDFTWIILSGIILAVLSVVVFWVLNRRMRRLGG
jgi:uncharacterized membrane protein